MTHPSDETLALLAHGRLDDESLQAVEVHLDTCAPCRSLLAAVTNGSTPYAEPERMALKTGERLGRYEIDVLLAAGGMGMLYTARDALLNRRVVLKLMRPRFADELGKVRLLREAQAMASLSHPNVVSVYELGESDGRVFVAMELVEGGTLRDWMKSPGTWKDVVAMMAQAGRGLAAAHAAGVVHRDFKPENVLVGKDGRPRVTDFGLARPDLVAREEPPRDAPMRVTRTGTMLGTPAYMSPEQLAGKPADARSDQYSFCVVLYEALTGKRPFVAETVEELRARVAGGMPPPPKDGAVPSIVWAVVARGLQPSPEKRFPSMEELLEILGEPIPRALMPRPSRAAIAGQIVMALTVLVLAGAGALTWWELRTPPLQIPADISAPTGKMLQFDAPGVQRVVATGNSLQRYELLNEKLSLITGPPGESTLVFVLDDGSARTAALHVHETPGIQPPLHTPTPDPYPDLDELPGEIDLSVHEERSFDLADIYSVTTDGPAIESTQQHEDGRLTLIGGRMGSTGTLSVVLADGRQWNPHVRVTRTAAEPELPKKVELDLGATRRFQLEDIKRVGTGDGSIVDVTSDDANIVEVTGTGLGATNLVVLTGLNRLEATVIVNPPVVPKPNGEVQLKTGVPRVWSIPGIQRIAIGDASIAEVKVVDGSKLQVVGDLPGSTTLGVWTAQGKRLSYAVTVAKPDPIPGATHLTLNARDIHRYPMDDIERCDVSDSDTISIDCESGVLEITGQQPGSATVRVWRQAHPLTLFAVQVR